jgi:hypothetical protein
MSTFACLDQPGPKSADLMISEGPFGVAVAFMLISISLAAVIAPLVRRAYRNRVQRLMGPNQMHPMPDGWWQTRSIRVESLNGDAKPVTGEARTASRTAPRP